MTDQVVVCLMTTSLNAGGVNMKNALKILGWKYEVIALGEPWRGFKHKIESYADFASKQASQAIIVFVDAYDALPARSPEGFVEVFKSFNSDLVIGAEHYCSVNCLPVDTWWLMHKDVEKNFGNYYVQSGCIVGRAFAMAELFNWCVSEKEEDDQVAVANYVIQHPSVKIWIDYENRIAFHDNWGNTAKFSIQDDYVTVTRDELATQPYFVHFPGFLAKRSIPLLSLPPAPLRNYDFVAKHILKDDFVQIGQYDGVALKYGCAVGLGVLIAFILAVIAVIAVLVYQCWRIRTLRRRLILDDVQNTEKTPNANY
jgi:hypothetical protein